jgi:hypothetical protein
LLTAPRQVCELPLSTPFIACEISTSFISVAFHEHLLPTMAFSIKIQPDVYPDESDDKDLSSLNLQNLVSRRAVVEIKCQDPVIRKSLRPDIALRNNTVYLETKPEVAATRQNQHSISVHIWSFPGF